MRVQPSLYPNSMEIRMMVSYTLFVYILRGASSLLVLTYRVMRRPQDVERVTGHSPRFFVYICNPLHKGQVWEREEAEEEVDYE